MQDLSILDLKSGLFFSTPLRVLWQGINSSINFALTIINLKVVPQQLLSPVDLPRTLAFHVYKTLEVVEICKHKNFMLATFKVVFSSFKSLNNG